MRLILVAALVLLGVVPVCAAELECISTAHSPVCVGEAHDSVVLKLDKSHVTGQSVAPGKFGQVVERSYTYQGEAFALRFERTSAGGLYRLTRISGSTAVKAKENVLALEPFLVNLADPAGKRYTRASVVVEAASAADAGVIRNDKPKTRNAVIMLLSSKSYEDIKSAEAKLKLKDEVRDALNKVFGREIARRVYIADMVIQ